MQFHWTYKWEKSNKLTLKIERIIFTSTWSISNNFDSNLLKINKKHYKAINIYYIGDTLQLNKLMVVKKFSVNPLSLLVNHASEYIKEKMEINTWFFRILLMKTKHY